MSHPLPGPLAHVAPLLDHYGYAAVAVSALVEGFGVPAPAVTLLVAAAVYAGSGHMSLVGVAVVALCAAVVGDNFGYGLGRLAGRPAIIRWGRFVGLTETRLKRAEQFVCRGGGNIIVAARFIDGLRQTAGLIAGTVGMPWRRFVVRDALGAVLWVTAWLMLGFFAGDHIDRIYATVKHYQAYLVVAAVTLVAAVVTVRVTRRARHLPHKRQAA